MEFEAWRRVNRKQGAPSVQVVWGVAGGEVAGLVTRWGLGGRDRTGLFLLQDLKALGGSGACTQRERVSGGGTMRGKAQKGIQTGLPPSNLLGPPLAGTDRGVPGGSAFQRAGRGRGPGGTQVALQASAVPRDV